MRKLTLASTVLVLVVPASAAAKPPTRAHLKQYRHEYAAARRHFGARAVGCYLLHRRGFGSCHVKATDAGVVKSLGTLDRLLYPPPPPPPVAVPAVATSTYQSTPVTSYAVSAPPSGGLVGCIIGAESGGSPTAMNSSGHGGIAGWSQSTWQQDVAAEGKTGYPSSPTAASYSQQLSVLQGEGSTPQGFGQQTKFDPCGGH